MAHNGVTISTPVATAMDVEHHHGAAAHDDVEMHAETGAEAPLHAAAAAAATGSRATFIPAAGYTMPAPTWRVKPQFANWEVDHTRFEVKRLLGKGSYGSVAEAVDHLTGQRVAIKKIPGVFEVRRRGGDRGLRVAAGARVLAASAWPSPCHAVAPRTLRCGVIVHFLVAALPLAGYGCSSCRRYLRTRSASTGRCASCAS